MIWKTWWGIAAHAWPPAIPSGGVRSPGTRPAIRLAEHEIDGLELGVAEQLLDALLATGAGQLDAAERHPGEVPGRAVAVLRARRHGAHLGSRVAGDMPDRPADEPVPRHGGEERQQQGVH